MKTLLLTLSTWFESAGSITEAANGFTSIRILFGTGCGVFNRRLKRSLEDPRDVAEIRTALIAHDMIPNERGS